MANWRQEIELLQNYPRHKTFTFTTTGSSAQTALDVAANFEEVNKISFVVELADAYISFDETATSSNMLIPQNEGYSDSGIYIIDKLSVIRSASTNVRIRGIAWGR
jgi:glucosamine 6-phosphate synthetase-like amidotransferase/phosphosugar isomerase protein